MALDAAVGNLMKRLEELGEAVAMLQWAAVEDRPRKGDSVLVDIIGGISDDLLALAREARQCATESRKALGPPPDLDRVRRLVTTCQERFNILSQRYFSELSAYERIAELKQLARERRGGWPAWSTEVTRSIERCREPLHEANQALFLCWQELAERAGATNISVRAVGVGTRVSHAGSTPQNADTL
jgi:hypothetical protein